MNANTVVDVRQIMPHDRHPLIFSTFAQLSGGQAMELVNDRDPLPLYQQFQARMPEGFGWDYLESGPAVWRVAITKRAASPSGCCGGCGGGGH